MGNQSFRRVSRRQVLQMLSISATGALLAACAPAQQSPSAPSQPASTPAQKAAAPAAQPAGTPAQQVAPAAKAQAGKTIKAAVLANFKGDALEKAIPQFENSSGIKVQLDKLPLEN